MFIGVSSGRGGASMRYHGVLDGVLKIGNSGMAQRCLVSGHHIFGVK